MSRWDETPNTLADAARPPFKALILTTQTGGGHWAVADALCTAFALGYGDRFQAEAIDLWAEHTGWPLNQLPKTYRPMVTSTPRLWGWTFYKSQARRVVRLGMRAAWPFAQRGVREALLAHAPDVIVAVHPLLQEIPLRILAELGWDVPFVTVVTDLATAHPAWFQKQAALCLAPTDEVRRLGLQAGLRPDQVVVTEDYPPNVALAKARLEPLGVRVVEVALSRVAPMPFGDGEFNLVLNRHSGFNADEVARILALGGVFLTQQVHGLWAADLIAAFGAQPQWPDTTPETYVPALERAGLVVDRLETWQGQLTFADVGAIVYYLRAVPWLVPGFSVATHADHLLALQQQQEAGKSLVFADRKYLVEARKPVTG